jgi:DNA-binding response OmpR family regulator
MARHILLIEDEPNIIEAMQFILMRDGWQVSTHPDGIGAEEAVRRVQPDVVVLDVMLPGRSGLDVLAALRADAATRSLPILMLTARGHSGDRAEAERIGVDRFMTKPFSNSEILAALRGMVAP